MGSWNRLSYHRRLFLWLLGYSMLLVGCFVVFQYNREKEFKVEEVNSQLQLINTYILTELEEGVAPADIDLDEFYPFKDIRVSVISVQGDVIYDNTLDSMKRSNHLDRQEIQQAVRYGAGFAVRRHSESTGDYYFYSAKRGDGNIMVRTAVPYSVSLATLLQADYGFLWIMGAITIVMCVLGYIATRRVGVHIMRLSRFAENVEEGAIISDTEPFPHDELGDISNHIVRLYAKLQQANADRDSEHRAALYQQEEKERIKKQLTNNINHELKTPIASIQLCVETLVTRKNLPEDKREQILQRCLANADRLRRLLTDVSLITRMDDGGNAIVKENLDLGDIVRTVVEEKEEIAASKGMELVAEIQYPLNMYGNEALLESIFNNLIDNAIAYSGGSEVRIALVSADAEQIILSVSDDGTGVPECHLPRLFERFYRIDKGRSRSAGGTGLGLAIVKNAVMLHGGSISVENRPDGGLLFMITLSRKS